MVTLTIWSLKIKHFASERDFSESKIMYKTFRENFVSEKERKLSYKIFEPSNSNNVLNVSFRTFREKKMCYM